MPQAIRNEPMEEHDDDDGGGGGGYKNLQICFRVQECTDSCGCKNARQSCTLERENAEHCALVYFHDWTNALLCCNVYVVHQLFFSKNLCT